MYYSLEVIKRLIQSRLESEGEGIYDVIDSYSSFDMALKFIDVLEKGNWLTSKQANIGRNTITYVKENPNGVADNIIADFDMDYINLDNMTYLDCLFISEDIGEFFNLEKDEDGFHMITEDSQLDFYPHINNEDDGVPFEIKVYDPLAQLIFENQDYFKDFINKRIEMANYYGFAWED